jgi:hypothetical protein
MPFKILAEPRDPHTQNRGEREGSYLNLSLRSILLILIQIIKFIDCFRHIAENEVAVGVVCLFTFTLAQLLISTILFCAFKLFLLFPLTLLPYAIRCCLLQSFLRRI